MKELQEEYLFLHREGINGWEDVYWEKHKAEHEISSIDAQKKELYKEHVRCKYRYEKEGDATVYLYHEAHYREQLAELKERRKEAKPRLGTINQFLKESTYDHLEIPDDVDIENLYLVDVPEFDKKPSYDSGDESYAEGSVTETEIVRELYENVIQADVTVAEPEELMTDYDLRKELSILEAVEEYETFGKSEFAPQPTKEETDVTTEEKTESVSKEWELVMTKEIYQPLTNKEKVEWLGLLDCELREAIIRFGEKMKGIGIIYKYGDDNLDDFMRLESVARQMKKEQCVEQEFVVHRGFEIKEKSR